jgi:hypothetical protein
VAVDSSVQGAKAIQTELVRRHKATARTVVALLVLTILLSAIAFLGKNLFRHQSNPSLDIAWRITILIFGLGSVVLRRTKFSTMRLQDIAALKGDSGLLRTLEKTTIQVALLGTVIGAFGFIATVGTGVEFYTYESGLVGLVVLLYCYPTRASWQRAIQKFSPDYPVPPEPPDFQATN